MSQSLLLYDKDCGICTKFAKLIARYFSIVIVSLNDVSIKKRGIRAIGETKYWQSFHMLRGDHWTTEDEAIIELCRNLPFGTFTHKAIQIPVLMKLSMFILKYMQNTRKLECKI